MLRLEKRKTGEPKARFVEIKVPVQVDETDARSTWCASSIGLIMYSPPPGASLYPSLR